MSELEENNRKMVYLKAEIFDLIGERDRIQSEIAKRMNMIAELMKITPTER